MADVDKLHEEVMDLHAKVRDAKQAATRAARSGGDEYRAERLKAEKARLSDELAALTGKSAPAASGGGGGGGAKSVVDAGEPPAVPAS